MKYKCKSNFRLRDRGALKNEMGIKNFPKKSINVLFCFVTNVW